MNLNRELLSSICGLSLFAASQGVSAPAATLRPAPTFEASDATGSKRKLADYAGKWVVLEWYNKDCPYVKKHYESKNMQKLQSTYTGKDVIWLSIISSAKGKQGFVSGTEAMKDAKDRGAAPTAILLDTTGEIGKKYGAKTTPHIFIVNPKGEIVYEGAIDDNDSSDSSVIPKSKNYVAQVLDAGLAGKEIPVASTKPYGCSVKY